MAQQSSWPGERQPSDRDIELGIESLDAGFLSQFKDALRATAGATEDEQLMQMRLDALATPTQEFTYPLSLLYDFPQLPPNDVVEALQQSFDELFQAHPFLNALPIPSPSQDPVNPFFRYSLACLVSAAAAPPQQGQPIPNQTAQDLFLAGTSLWNVMLEVDNREARTLEGVLSPVLLSVYAFLTADFEIWSHVEQQLLPSALAMARRLRLHDPFTSQGTSTPLSLGAPAKSSVITLLFLMCTLSAIHMNIPVYMTSAELISVVNSDGKPSNFQALYQSLLHEGLVDHYLPWLDGNPLLLLVAILSDTICIQRALTSDLLKDQRATHPKMPSYANTSSFQETPCPALSPESEYSRMSECINNFLDKWHEKFASKEGRRYLALYYFCRLCVECPHISHLPGLVGYPPNGAATVPSYTMALNEFSVSDRAVDFAWATVEHTGLGDEDRGTVRPIWEPLVVFLAALVVWAKKQQSTRSSGGDYRRKELLVYKLELEKMSWPCCKEMASSIDQVLQKS